GHQREAVMGVFNGGGQHIGQRPRAVVAQHGDPAAECTGYRGGQYPYAGNLFQAESAECLYGCVIWSGTLSANGAGFLLLLAPQQNGDIAAGASQVRLDDLQYETAGNRRVEGVAASFEDAHG